MTSIAQRDRAGTSRNGHSFAPTGEHLWRAADDTRLAVYDWKAVAPRGTALIVHGLGEHALRYNHVAAWFVSKGYAVRAYDQFGHGHSDGPRGGLARDLQLCEHLAQLAAVTDAHGQLLVVGHSLGGLVVASAVARKIFAPDRVLLSSPALAVETQAWQRVALAVLPKILPSLRVGNGVRPQFISHDESVVRAYRDDPLVHDRICARLGAFVANESAFVRAAAANWAIDTLLTFAGDDRLVDARGSREFLARAPAKFVQGRCFETLYHEIFNELDNDCVFDAVAQWLRPGQG